MHFNEFLVSAKKVKSLNLIDKNVKFLWRENLYNKELETEINSIVINDEYIKNISEPEKAALGYAAVFIENECEWDGNMAENRGNLKCKILPALNLGYQCSNTHLEFLKRWFRNNETVLKELERCPTKPDGATEQNTFDEINIDINENNITVFFNGSGYNLRESETWNWTEKHYFEFKENELILIKKNISPKEHHTFEVTEN